MTLSFRQFQEYSKVHPQGQSSADLEFITATLQTLELFYQQPVRYLCFGSGYILAPDLSQTPLTMPTPWLEGTCGTECPAGASSFTTELETHPEAMAPVHHGDQVIGALVLLPSEEPHPPGRQSTEYLTRYARILGECLAPDLTTEWQTDVDFDINRQTSGFLSRHQTRDCHQPVAGCPTAQNTPFLFEAHPAPTVLVEKYTLRLMEVNHAARQLLSLTMPGGHITHLNEIYRFSTSRNDETESTDLETLHGYEQAVVGTTRGQHPTEHELTITEVFDGQRECLLISITDHVDRTLEAEDAKRIAATDTLTGLKNRLAFEQGLEGAFHTASHSDSQIGILLIDIDHLKLVNDTLGHECGDSLLQTIGQRLKTLENRGHMVTRLGGDEFALLLSNTTCAEVRRVLKLVPELINQPVDLNNDIIRPTASIGAACYPKHAPNAAELRKCADVALYAAKNRGRNKVRLYSSTLRYKRQRCASLNHQLRKAIDTHEINAAYLPVLNLRTNCVEHLSAQPVFANRPTRIGTNATLFDYMADHSLAASLFRETLTTVLADSRYLTTESGTAVSISVPTPVSTLCRNTFCSDLARTVAAAKVQPDRLILDIEEKSISPRNFEEVMKRLQSLLSEGFRVGLANFGNGIASLSYLSQLQLTYIKMEAPMIERLNANRSGRGLLRAGFSFAEQLSLPIIATNLRSDVQEWTFDQLGGTFGQRGGVGAALTLQQLLNFHSAEDLRNQHA
ncbi:GGDEF domain-containing protein [Pseudovibrio exalbescens]|uniref:Uncharacterized protein n=1 Tax=Pseudovibrio exalbescens TaxID=197461 RepID=A0A1U7JL32_9HYPH|nr:diguanylate cyclase [Pseudovibrio exalbescens]OKL45427.1 hypothetical protein A3843_03655 [Pseudovibrio exalbescens]